MALSLDVRALARAARQKKQESLEGEAAAAAARKESERAMFVDRAQAAASAIAVRASSTLTERSKLTLAADVLEGVCYWPEFLTEAEEASLVAAIDLVSEGRWIGGEESDERFAQACCPASETTATATAATSTTASAARPPPGRRRRANFGGSPSSLKSSEELPQFLQSLCDALTVAGAFAKEEPANFVLINDYTFGAGLPRHSDGPLYAASATITLCGSAALELHRIEDEDVKEEEKERENAVKENPGGKEEKAQKQKSSIQLLLRPRAALSLRGESYEKWEHGVSAVDVDLIREECANCEAARVEVGDRVPRSPRRISLVFVNKRKV